MEKKTISLALAFSAILHEWLTPEQMAEVIHLNKTKYAGTNTCATHDFCDPNQAVIDAYAALGHVTPLTPEDDDPNYEITIEQINKDIDEVSKMWNYARSHDFFHSLYVREERKGTSGILMDYNSIPQQINVMGDKHRDVRVNGKYLILEQSLQFVNHSPDGFNWGYSGSGPAQLALAILLQFMSREDAAGRYQQFKSRVVATWPPNSFDATVNLRQVIVEIDKERLAAHGKEVN